MSVDRGDERLGDAQLADRDGPHVEPGLHTLVVRREVALGEPRVGWHRALEVRTRAEGAVARPGDHRDEKVWVVPEFTQGGIQGDHRLDVERIERLRAVHPQDEGASLAVGFDAHASTPARSGPRSCLAAILTRGRLRVLMSAHCSFRYQGVVVVPGNAEEFGADLPGVRAEERRG